MDQSDVYIVQLEQQNSKATSGRRRWLHLAIVTAIKHLTLSHSHSIATRGKNHSRLDPNANLTGLREGDFCLAAPEAVIIHYCLYQTIACGYTAP